MSRLVFLLLTAALFAGLTAGTANATHVACGDVITQDTTLDSDLVDCPGDGIVIGADDITLDLGGHTVDGDNISSGAGVCDMGVAIVPSLDSECFGLFDGEGHADVTLRGGNVREFDAGVVVADATGPELRDLRVSRNDDSGIVVQNSDHAVINDSEAFENVGQFAHAFGIVASATPGIVIEKNSVWGNGGSGIEAEDVDGSRIEGNRFSSNANGLHVHSTRSALVTANIAVSNRSVGLEVSDGVHENVISRNTASANGDAGIFVFEGAHGNRVDANRVLGNAPGDDPFHFFRGGIVVDGETAIRRNVVSGNVDGIMICCGRDNLAEENRVTGNRRSGVFIGDDGNTVRRNRISHNGHNGIEAWDSGHNRIEENVISRNRADGIFGRGFTDTVVRANAVIANEGAGLDVGDGLSGTALVDNRVWDNGATGIHMEEGAHDTRVVGNSVRGNALDPRWLDYTAGGIFLGEGNRNEISGNRMSRNGGRATIVLAYTNRDNVISANHLDHNRGDGIVLAAVSGNVVEANRVSHAGGDGIYVEPDASGNVVRRNFAARNGDDGMDADSAFTTFAGNVAVANADLGIEAVSGVTDGGGNRASGNGDPLQCLNVFCR